MRPNKCPKCGLITATVPHADSVLRDNGWKTATCIDCGYVHSYKRIEGDVSGKSFMKEMELKGITHIIGLFDG